MSYADRKPAPDDKMGYDEKKGLITVPDQKSSYTLFYNRLYQLLKTGSLDFAEIAQKIGFRERRIRDTLLFRLGSGEVRQLFGLESGFCYLCMGPVLLPKEPMCLVCLQHIDEFSIPIVESEEDATWSLLASDVSLEPSPTECTLAVSNPTDESTVNDRTEDSESEQPAPLPEDIFASLPTLPDPDNLFPLEGEEDISESPLEPMLLTSLRPPRRYGFERMKPLR